MFNFFNPLVLQRVESTCQCSTFRDQELSGDGRWASISSTGSNFVGLHFRLKLLLDVSFIISSSLVLHPYFLSNPKRLHRDED